MQKSSFNTFLQEIKDIQEYIKHIEMINQIEKNTSHIRNESIQSFNKHLASFHTRKKLFEYKSITISLYGILEKYVSIWIKEHIENLKNIISDYEKIPKKITQSHFDLSIKLINNISENRHTKYTHLDKEDVLKNLNKCLIQPNNYRLNSDAFIPSSGNLKHQVITETFKPLDINLTQMINKQIEPIRYTTIDDLVVRRNDIAHGSQIDNILGTSEFEDYIKSLEKYGKALFTALDMKDIEYESSHLYIKIEEIIGVFNNSILAFKLKDNTINVGDYIIIKTDNDKFYKKEILSIELNKNALQAYTTSEEIDIAINLTCGLKPNQSFYIKKRV